MARSSALVLVALAGSGCDLVFGLDGEARPCELEPFTDVTPTDLVSAEDFSIDWDMTFGVVVQDIGAFEIDLATNELTPIELGAWVHRGLALTPEGRALFYTSFAEPPILKGALRGGPAAWQLDAGVPRGTFAGTPSADVYGPRRLLVKMREGSDEVQEYEDRSGRWTPIGTPRALQSRFAPNLTPNGLTMVYAGVDATGAPAVLAAQRPSTDAEFGEPMVVLPGEVQTAQLLGQCKQLYTSDGQMLRRYAR